MKDIIAKHVDACIAEIRGEVEREIHAAPNAPDPHDPLAVLAFLMVPAEAFLDQRDDAHTRAAVEEMLATSKRQFLLDWYAHHTRRTP